MRRRKLKLWQLILAGPFLIWMGFHEYGELADLEEHGGTLYVNSFTKALYDLGGKNLVLVVTVGFGVFYLWALHRWWKLEREFRRANAANEAADDAAIAGVAPSKRPEPAPAPAVRREPPPRVGDDPFREPPAPPPIQVVHTARPISTPIAPRAPSSHDEGANDGPKLLR